MRVARLLLVAVVVLLAARTAASQQVSNTKEPSARIHNSRHADIPPLTPQQQAQLLQQIQPAKAASDGRFNIDDLPAGTEVCLTLHTLQVARDEGSDSTHLVAERTCTPAHQFEMKSAVAVQK